jgi:uncharacterized protein (TIGR00251 family)
LPDLGECVARLGPGVWRLEVWVQPGARRNEVVGVLDGRLKLKLAAPAVDNKANETLVAFVASLLGLKPRQVTLVQGQASRRKSVRIESAAEPPWPRVAPGV